MMKMICLKQKGFNTMKCVDLKENDQVVFLTYSDLFKKKIYETGTVVFINHSDQTVSVSWLEGYKDRNSMVNFSDMVAKYDKDGEYMKFGNISGPSVLLDEYIEAKNQADSDREGDSEYEQLP